MVIFANRAEAGRRLAQRLDHLRSRDVIVVGLPRGGIPVAFEVARALEAPLDVIVVRKLGVPFQPELAMGAIGEDGIQVINERVKRVADVSDPELARVVSRETAELNRRARRFRADRPRTSLEDRTVIVVDDGVATGSTVAAACQVARAEGANRVVVAVPVAPPGWPEQATAEADEVICLETPRGFMAISQFYGDFTQTTDEEVVGYLTEAAAGAAEPANPGRGRRIDRPVDVYAGPVLLPGRLRLPASPVGIVVFAHGSGSSRHSPRNRFVADVLGEAGMGTLLFDLLTTGEEQDRRNVFDITLLGRRLADIIRWLRSQPETRRLPIGLFGASTGAAAALWAAAEPDSGVAAVVSRGGRPDLAGRRLGQVTAPTRLIVGSRDPTVMELNRRARAELHCDSDLIVVPGATHLFEEPGTLQQAAESARDWFVRHLVRPGTIVAGGSRPRFDPAMARLRDDADAPAPETRSGQTLLVEREEAEGVEIFESPERVIPRDVAIEGSPGHESLSADQAGLSEWEEESPDRGEERQA